MSTIFELFFLNNNFAFSAVEIVFFGVLLLVFIYQIYYYVRYINASRRYNNKVKKNGHEGFDTKQPPVSVIICAKNEEENLQRLLPLIMEQDYPEFEVIVINDASADNTDIVLDNFKKQYANLRTTFVPQGTTNVSTKKLGLTLGIKAAKSDLLLFTDADCRPASKNWISTMVRNFTPETEFVLGYGAYNEENTKLNRLITYDTLFVALQYLGFALAHRPYMGVGRNLAYRKETFFAQNGFAATLHLRSGDDDLLVNRAGTHTNTRVEVSRESVTWSEPKRKLRDWLYQKNRHLSVSDHYSFGSRLQLIAEPCTRGLFYASFILSLILGNWGTVAAAGLLFLARYFTQFFVINKASKHFGGRRYVTTILFADIFLPLFNLYILLFKGSYGKRRQKLAWK
jgi:glycosyltransferase involved in cell wall biosynthesis